MNEPWVKFITSHLFLMLVLSCLYMIPLTIIYFSINKWGKKTIAFSIILYILIGLIILSYLSVAIWAVLIAK
jgi:hypothetical protein